MNQNQEQLNCLVTLADIEAAAARIRGKVHRTPVLTSTRWNDMVQAKLFFKCENFQKVGAFKARGAMNAVLSLSDEECSRGVVTHSSGNHGAALAWLLGTEEYGLSSWSPITLLTPRSWRSNPTVQRSFTVNPQSNHENRQSVR